MGNLADVLPYLLRRIVCPDCRASLIAQTEASAPVSLRCTGCGRNYPVIDGIPILLAAQAVPRANRPE
jgi:uncharacterized protein YbaR (Trm112 family)